MQIENIKQTKTVADQIRADIQVMKKGITKLRLPQNKQQLFQSLKKTQSLKQIKFKNGGERRLIDSTLGISSMDF